MTSYTVDACWRGDGGLSGGHEVWPVQGFSDVWGVESGRSIFMGSGVIVMHTLNPKPETTLRPKASFALHIYAQHAEITNCAKTQTNSRQNTHKQTNKRTHTRTQAEAKPKQPTSITRSSTPQTLNPKPFNYLQPPRSADLGGSAAGR